MHTSTATTHLVLTETDLVLHHLEFLLPGREVRLDHRQTLEDAGAQDAPLLAVVHSLHEVVLALHLGARRLARLVLAGHASTLLHLEFLAP